MATYPFEFEEFDSETNEAIKRDFGGYINGLGKMKPFGHVMPPNFKEWGPKIYNMEVRPDDVWIVTYPKTGTTWTQAAIWSVLNDGDFDRLNNEPLLSRWNFLEFDSIATDGVESVIQRDNIPEDKASVLRGYAKAFDRIVSRPSPRLIKSHLPLALLPPNLLDTAKVVYIARNPKDTCVSYFHHHKLMRVQDFQGDFPTFFDYFLKDLILQNPYWPHIIDGWNRRRHPNMLFMFYEDMKKDFSGALRKLGTFLGKPLSEDMVKQLNEDLSIEGMKKNPLLNMEHKKGSPMMNEGGKFIRKGIVGDWKNHFTPEMEERMNEWSKKHREGCDIVFPGEATGSV